MSTDADNIAARPIISDQVESEISEVSRETAVKNWKKSRRVCFPEDECHLVTEYFEPANPWQSVGIITPDELADKYVDSCQSHGVEPIIGLVEQIKAYPLESLQCEERRGAVGLAPRLPRLRLSGAALSAKQADALESVLRRVQFKRIDLDDCAMDDETAVALFDMIEYYESATILNISGNREFGIRGWQACSRMMKKSQCLWEVEARDTCVGQAHAPVLCRALRPASCRLRALRLPRASLAGQPVVCLVGALKQNRSVRELQVCDNGLTPDDAAQLACLLRCNTTLQLLDLSNNQIQDAGMQHLAEGLAEQSHATPSSPHSDTSPTCSQYEKGLAVLVLWNNQLTRNSANALSRALASSRSLCVLNVGANAVGCEGVRGMAEALVGAGGGALLCLGLQAARLAAPAAKAIADVLHNNTTLQRIDLRDNRLAVVGLRVLASAMKQNNTITQIDLDDIVEPHPNTGAHHDAVGYEAGEVQTVTLSMEEERAEAARLTCEIRAKCRHNEVTPHATPPPPPAPARKISLTCQTLHRPVVHADAQKPSSNVLELRNSPETRRLRSPLPSPIPSPLSSPTPRGRVNRFQVSRVPSDVGSSTDTESSPSPTTPPSNSGVSPRQAFFATPDIPATSATRVNGKNSRFRVVHVTETPNSYVKTSQKTPESKKRASSTPLPVKATSRFSVTRNYDSAFDVTATKPAVRSDAVLVNVTILAKSDSKLCDDETADNLKTNQNEVFCNSTAVETEDETKIIDEMKLIKLTKAPIINLEGEPLDFKEDISELSASDKRLLCESDISDNKINVNVIMENDSTVTYSELDDRKVQLDNKVQNAIEELFTEEKKSSDCDPMREIAEITEGLGNLLREMKDVSDKTSLLKRKPIADDFTNKHSERTESSVTNAPNETWTSMNMVNVELSDDRKWLKKNRSESSLDSSDLEVSKYMQHKNRAFYDSSSSLEISGSSVESLNTLESMEAAQRSNNSQSVTFEIGNSTLTKHSQDERKKSYLPKSSTESSVEWNTSVAAMNRFLPPNASFSSNDSVSPNPFGKHVKLHGSLSSLEASIGSMDSCRTSEISFSEEKSESSQMTESTTSKEFSSNEGTLTNDSKLIQLRNTLEKDATESDVSETVTITNLAVMNDISGPRRTNSEIHIPEKTERIRKCSWVAPTANFSLTKPTDSNRNTSKDTQIQKVDKVPTNLEKLLSIFQHPGSLFSRSISSSSQEDREEKATPNVNNAQPKKESVGTTGFWSWSLNTSSENKNQSISSTNIDGSTGNLERVQKSYVDDVLTRSLSTDNSPATSDKKEENDLEIDLIEIKKLERLSDATTNVENPTGTKSVQHDNKTESQSVNVELEIRSSDMSKNNVTNLVDKNNMADVVQMLDLSKSDIIQIKNDIQCAVDEINSTNIGQFDSITDDRKPETEIGELAISEPIVSDLKIDLSEPITDFCKTKISPNHLKINDSVKYTNEPKRNISEPKKNNSRKIILSDTKDNSEYIFASDDADAKIPYTGEKFGEHEREVSEPNREISEPKTDISHPKTDNCERDVCEPNRDVSVPKIDSSDLQIDNSEPNREISEPIADSSESKIDITTPKTNISIAQSSCGENLVGEIENSDKTNVSELNLMHDVTNAAVFGKFKTDELEIVGTQTYVNVSESTPQSSETSELDTDPSDNYTTCSDVSEKEKYGEIIFGDTVHYTQTGYIKDENVKIVDENVKLVDENVKMVDENVKWDDVNVKPIDGSVKIVDERVELVDESVKPVDESVKVQCDTKELADLKVSKPYVISSDDFTNRNVDFKLCIVNSRLSLYDNCNETSHFEAINENLDVETGNTLNIAGSAVSSESYSLDCETKYKSEDIFDKVLRSMDRNAEVGIDTAISLLSPNRNCERNNAKAEMGEKFEFQERRTEVGKVALEILGSVQERPRTFASVLKSAESNSERTNSSQAQVADNSTSVGNLSSRIIRSIKENISPENTITLNFTNTYTIENEMTEKMPLKNDSVGIESVGTFCTIDSTDISSKADNETIDVAKDALVLLESGEHEFEGDTLSPANKMTVPESMFTGLATLDVELRHAERQNSDEKSPELVTDECHVEEITEYFSVNEQINIKQTEKLILKRSNSLEDVALSYSPACKEMSLDEMKSGFELSVESIRNDNLCVPQDSLGCSTSEPKDIPELSSTNTNMIHHKAKRGRRGSNRSSCSPKSLPDSLSQANASPRLPISDVSIPKVRRMTSKMSTLGKIARDSLLALNISEEEIADFKQSHKLRSVDSLRSIESVSEDGLTSHSGHETIDYATCIRTSQESLMSLESISEDRKSVGDCDDYRQ